MVTLQPLSSLTCWLTHSQRVPRATTSPHHGPHAQEAQADVLLAVSGRSDLCAGAYQEVEEGLLWQRCHKVHGERLHPRACEVSHSRNTIQGTAQGRLQRPG